MCTWLASRAELSYSASDDGAVEPVVVRLTGVQAACPQQVHVVEAAPGELGSLLVGDIVGQAIDIQPQQRRRACPLADIHRLRRQPLRSASERHRLEVGRARRRWSRPAVPASAAGCRRSRPRTAVARSAARRSGRRHRRATGGSHRRGRSGARGVTTATPRWLDRRASGSARGRGPPHRRADEADAGRAAASWPDRHRRTAASPS